MTTIFDKLRETTDHWHQAMAYQLAEAERAIRERDERAVIAGLLVTPEPPAAS